MCRAALFRIRRKERDVQLGFHLRNTENYYLLGKIKLFAAEVIFFTIYFPRGRGEGIFNRYQNI